MSLGHASTDHTQHPLLNVWLWGDRRAIGRFQGLSLKLC
jgi:hypothetical protein